MRFGKTYEQKHLEEQRRRLRCMIDIEKFAWLPTRLDDGSWAWLTAIYVDSVYWIWERYGNSTAEPTMLGKDGYKLAPDEFMLHKQEEARKLLEKLYE